MEKNQYELCVRVLQRLAKAGILEHLVLAGSWCMVFYRDYFAGTPYKPSIRTRDLDFLVPIPSRITGRTDVAELLKDLGFVVGFSGSKGYIRLEHPQLILEFLVPEKGRATDKPFPLPQLGLNAQQLRFMELLARNTITVEIQGIELTMPHPANFALHKLLVASKRPTEAKRAKDIEAGLKILKALLDKGEKTMVAGIFRTLHRRWQTRIRKALLSASDETIRTIFD